jgi:hypothetical protein
MQTLGVEQGITGYYAFVSQESCSQWQPFINFTFNF